MNTYAGLPVVFLKFWFFEAPRDILAFFGSVNTSFLRFSSLPMYLKTFFKPMKNEYRKGLVGFSIGIGIFVKTVFILLDLVLLAALLVVELVLLLIFIGFPFLTIAVLFL